jgi:diphthamide biosynthesis methyltransferase
MKPADAVDSLTMMFMKLKDSAEEIQGNNALEKMRIEACKQYLEMPIEQRVVVLCSDMGCSNEQIITTTVGQLSQHQGGRLNCLVFPSNLSDVEEAALLRWK